MIATLTPPTLAGEHRSNGFCPQLWCTECDGAPVLADVREDDKFLPTVPGTAGQDFDHEFGGQVVGRSSGVEGGTKGDDGWL